MLSVRGKPKVFLYLRISSHVFAADSVGDAARGARCCSEQAAEDRTQAGENAVADNAQPDAC